MSENIITMLLVFCIGTCGYLIGKINIKGICLGSAAIFLVGLVFGHFGAELPQILQSIGLVLFGCSVGLTAGPGFLKQLRQSGLQYTVLCCSTALIGSLLCVALIRLVGLDAPLAVGIMTGAFTSSPAFAAAKEVAPNGTAHLLAAGYGLVYPVGVVCKVLYIQLVPKLLHADMAKERAAIALPTPASNTQYQQKGKRIDRLGMFPFCLAATLGVLLGTVEIPLPNGAFSLGSTGGALIASLVIGAIGHVGKLRLDAEKSFLTAAKEIGLLFFFSGAGVEGGRGIAEILEMYGALPILYGLILIWIPLCAGFLLFRYVLRLPLLNGLAAMSACMTSTPSLAVLIQSSGTDDVLAAYGTTFPIALMLLITLMRFLVLL